MSTQPLAAPNASQNPPAGYTPIVENGQNVGLSTKDWGDIVSERPAPAVVAFPDGSNVQFPDAATAEQHSSHVWQQLKSAVMPSAEFLGNEVKGAGQMVMGLPSAIADSVTVQPTAEEQKSLGVSANPTLAQKAALALYRNLGQPIENAAQWYATAVRNHQNIIDAIPQDVLAQGLGAGAGAAVLGKVLAPSEEAPAVAAQPKPVVSAEPTVKSVEAHNGEVAPPETAHTERVSSERRTTERPALLSAAEFEDAIRNRQPVRTPVDETPGAQATIDADIRQQLSEAPSGRNARRAEPVQTVIPGTGVEEVKPETPDTRPDVPTFYSKAERVTQEKIPNNASGDQILATLRNNGVKENEIGWIGLDDFLKDKPKVSKADLQQFIKENQIQLGEVNRPANGSDSASLNTEKNNIHDYIDAVRGRNVDSPLGKALDAWLKDEGPESTSKLLSHPDVTPELASQISRYDQLDEQLKGAPERPAKYSKYVLDGPKENYNEKLLTLPQKDVPIPSTVASDALRKYQSELVNKYGVNENSSTGVNLAKATAEESDRYYNLQQDARTEEVGNRRAQEAAGQYKNPHFEEPNVLAHVRHDDRIDTDGKKNLFLEEVQSDWHQAGKQEGYRAPVDTKELARQLDNANDVYQAMSKKLAANPEDAQVKADAHAAFQETQRLERAYNAAAAQRGVPDAPFKNDWHELVMKRMLREAAEKGYDRLSWTTGDQQADRYDLSHHIGRVQYDPDANELTAYDPHGHQVIEEKVDPDVDELAKYIGKEPAQKLADQIDSYEPRPSDDSLWDMYSQDYHIKEIPSEEEDGEPRYGVFNEGYGRDPEETFDSENAAANYINDQVRFNVENYEHDGSELPEISGLDLKVGGEWAAALYNRAIPNFLSKYTKKWGAKVGTTYIPVGEGEKGGLNYHLIAPNGELYDAFRTRQQAEDALKSVAQPGTATRWHIQDHSPDDEAVHSIDINDKMRKSLLKEGQPLASTTNWQDIAREQLGGKEKSAISYQDAEKSVLRDFEPSNVSRDEFEDNLAKLNKRLPISESEATPGKVANALVKRHIADSVNPDAIRALVFSGQVPLQDLYGEELASKSMELDPNPREVPAHEAGHAVIAHHYGVPVSAVSLYPEFRFTKGSGKPRLSAALTNLDPEKFNKLSNDQRATTLMGGVAGEQATGFKYNPVTESADMSILRDIFSDKDVEAARAEGRAEANRLLTGELAGKHQQLTELFREQFGTRLKFEDFKRILGGIGVAVTAPQLANLWTNYSRKNDSQ